MDRSKVWTTELVNDAKNKLEQGVPTDLSCFFVHDLDLRRANINFKYSQEEQKEVVRCANDILYFADKYAYSMTDDGIQKITLRPYQRRMLKSFQDNRWVILLASRQVGKCVFSANVDMSKDGYSINKTNMNLLYYTALRDTRRLTPIEFLIFNLYRLYAKLA